MKAGIFVVAELNEPVREKILEVQRWADPRLAAGSPPHVTMVGSSGVGPLPLGTRVELLREKIEPIGSDLICAAFALLSPSMPVKTPK